MCSARSAEPRHLSFNVHSANVQDNCYQVCVASKMRCNTNATVQDNYPDYPYIGKQIRRTQLEINALCSISFGAVGTEGGRCVILPGGRVERPQRVPNLCLPSDSRERQVYTVHSIQYTQYTVYTYRPSHTTFWNHSHKRSQRFLSKVSARPYEYLRLAYITKTRTQTRYGNISISLLISNRVPG